MMDEQSNGRGRTAASPRVLVPIAEVAAFAYRAVFTRLGLLLELAWIPLLAMLAATLLPGYLQFYLGWHMLPAWQGDGYGLGLADLIEVAAGLLCLNAFAVRWHQAMLFAGEGLAPPGVFSRAWLRFIAYTLLLYLVSAVVLAVLLLASANEDAAPYLAPIAGLAITFIWAGMVRCSLLFPAAAFGNPLGLGGAWRAMRGNSWRLLGCGIIACAPAMLIVIVLLSGLSAELQLDQSKATVPLGFFILRGVIETCMNFVIVALGASVLSTFYRRILLRGLGTF
ncbi:MAG TPA: hypothetical protein VJR47_17735 [Stellaceae bacterium]|nr:hypothetical protein [Stellaceae bacterium]